MLHLLLTNNFKPMKTRFIYSLVFLAFTLPSIAQKQTGKIIEASSNKPLAGASIIFTGSNTVSDKDGAFSINCNGNRHITASYCCHCSYA
jgi:iron complex outermembrane recepter protein